MAAKLWVHNRFTIFTKAQTVNSCLCPWFFWGINERWKQHFAVIVGFIRKLGVPLNCPNVAFVWHIQCFRQSVLRIRRRFKTGCKFMQRLHFVKYKLCDKLIYLICRDPYKHGHGIQSWFPLLCRRCFSLTGVMKHLQALQHHKL